MKNWPRRYLGLISGLLLLLPLPASAVEYGGIGAKPSNPDPANPRSQSIFVYTLNPGDAKHDAVTLYNNTGSKKTIAVYAVDSQTSSGGAFACAQKVDQKSEVGSWVSLAQEEVVLNAGDKQEVPFDLNVPTTAGVGEHDGCLVVQDASATAREGGGIALSFRSALRFVVTIPGATYKKLSFIGLARSVSKTGAEILRPSVKNDGNVSVDTDVEVAIKNLFGVTIGKGGGSYPILPRSQAEWNFEVKRPFWGGIYTASAQASYDPSNKPIGVSSGTKTTLKGPHYTFWVSPQPLAAAIELVVLVALVGGGWLWYRRRAVYLSAHKHWQQYTIEKSDTLIGLSEKHGVSWQKVARVNKIKAPYHLKPGQTLLLPRQKD